MTFAPGDHVHVASLGKGIVREVRNGGRCLVEIKGRAIVTTLDQMTRDESSGKTRASKVVPVKRSPDTYESASSMPLSLDLHGKIVDEALDAVNAFLNTALLSGSAEVRLIHGRSGGRLKVAVHAMLRRMPSIRSFTLDPQNPGVTIVRL
jgi:DNA mismatch repair protein MutS2